MKNLEQLVTLAEKELNEQLKKLVEAAKKEGYKRDPEHWCNKDDEWLEAKMKEAHEAGYNQATQEGIETTKRTINSLKYH